MPRKDTGRNFQSLRKLTQNYRVYALRIAFCNGIQGINRNIGGFR